MDPDGELSIAVVDGLEALSDKSLIRVRPTDHGEPRFERHTLLREFAADRLERAGERADPASAATRWCSSRSPSEPGRSSVGDEADRWLDVLDHEQHNLRAAMRWSLTADEPDVGLRIASPIWRYWQHRPNWRRARPGPPSCWRIRRRDRIRWPGSVPCRPRAGWLLEQRFRDARGAAYDERLAARRALARRTADRRGALRDSVSWGSSTRTPRSCAITRRGAGGVRAAGATPTALVRARQALVLVHILIRRLRRGARVGAAQPRRVPADRGSPIGLGQPHAPGGRVDLQRRPGRRADLPARFVRLTSGIMSDESPGWRWPPTSPCDPASARGRRPPGRCRRQAAEEARVTNAALRDPPCARIRSTSPRSGLETRPRRCSTRAGRWGSRRVALAREIAAPDSGG